MTRTETATMSPQELEAIFELYPVPIQQAVARGDVDELELAERITSTGLELCPACGVHEIPPKLASVGICGHCVAKRSLHAHNEILSDLEDQRARTEQKQRVKRAREKLGLNPRINRAALLDRAVQFLRDQLADGPVSKPLIFERAAENGFSEAIVNAARKRLDVETVRGADREFAWRLLGELELEADEEDEPARPPGPDTAIAEDYGRDGLTPTDEHRQLTKCQQCGRTMVKHAPDDELCPYCQERVSAR